jgi:fructokinase
METQRESVIVGLGEILWDLLPDGKQLGGAPANFAYHANALGTHGVVVSCVGDDQPGKDIIRYLQEHKLRTDFIQVKPKYPTGTVSVELDTTGTPQYTIHENVAWDHIANTPDLKTLAMQTKAVCFGSLAQRSEMSRQTIREFVSMTSSDCYKVFDINLRSPYFDRDIVHDSLTLCNILKLNDEELPKLVNWFGLPKDRKDTLATLYNDFSIQLIVLTRGPNGSVLFNGSQISEIPGKDIRIVNTVGAGDSFTAAVVVGLLNKFDLSSIHQTADQLASYVCTQPGAMPAIPTSKKIQL